MKHKFSSLNDLIAQKLISDEDYNDDEFNVIKDLREIYNVFLDNYKKLNSEIDIKEPIDYFCLFNLLLKKGYLSNSKNFDIDDDDSVQIFRNDMLEGINILLGKGVCRHASALLSDMLNDFGLKSKPIGCYLSYSNEESNFLKKLKDYFGVCSILGVTNALSIPFIEVVATHSIVRSSTDENDYFFDSLNGEVLIPNKDKINSLTAFKYNVDVDSGLVTDKTFSDYEYFITSRRKVSNIFSGNKDIFDKFYNDNLNIYEEINDKAKVLKRDVIY